MPAATDPRRDLLLDMFGAALAAVEGRTRTRAALAGRAARDTWVLAIGKAASAMALGALDALGPAVSRLLVVTRADCLDPALTPRPGLRCILAGHPLPDEHSLAAAAEALAMARQAPPGQDVLMLISGGASSLFESPLPGISLGDLRRLNEWALASGLDIGRINAIRAALSRVKGGRLLVAFAHCRVEGCFISDVPGDDPAVVGSGLLAADAAVVPVDPAWPAWVREALAGQPPAARGSPVPVTCVGSLDEALAAAQGAARAAGLCARLESPRLDGDVLQAARRVCDRLEAADEGEAQLFGGETTLKLPSTPGRGGRNQHLALAVAQRIAGRPDLLVLACGTDGSDGNTVDGGALVDGATIGRGRDAGLDAGACLERADSGRFLEASGDLVHTGATGTNVGDLLFALRREPRHSGRTPLSM